jgi:hypothetical protein
MKGKNTYSLLLDLTLHLDKVEGFHISPSDLREQPAAGQRIIRDAHCEFDVFVDIDADVLAWALCPHGVSILG